MKKISMTCLLFVAVMGVARGAAADEGPTFVLGADLAVVLPFGAWAEPTQVGLGALLDARYHLTPNVALTARVGYIYHIPKYVEGGGRESWWYTSEMPILLGAKYFFGDRSGPYIAAELGYINLWTGEDYKIYRYYSDGSTFYNDVYYSCPRIGATVGGGYELSGIDLRAQLFIPNLLLQNSAYYDSEDIYLGFLFNVGYHFELF